MAVEELRHGKAKREGSEGTELWTSLHIVTMLKIMKNVFM